VSNRLIAILTILSLAAVTLLMRAALEYWPIGLTGAGSRVVTIAILGAWVLGTGAGWRRLAPRGAGGLLVVMGVFAIAINLLLFAALKWTTATNHALLYRLDVVFVILLGGLLGLERIGWRALVLLPVMLLGIALVAEVGSGGLQMHVVGDLMVVGAAAGFAINAFIIRRILQSMDVEATALVNVTITWLGFAGWAILQDDLAHVGPAVGDPLVWSWVILLGTVYAFFMLLYYVALRRMPVWKLRMWMLSTPVLVAVADAALWGTRLSVQQGIGMALVLVGLAGLIRLERNGRFRRRVVQGGADVPSVAGRTLRRGGTVRPETPVDAASTSHRGGA